MADRDARLIAPRLTKRQRRQGEKAVALDVLAHTVDQWDPIDQDGIYGLTLEERQQVWAELSQQLRAWAVRITPERAMDTEFDGD